MVETFDVLKMLIWYSSQCSSSDEQVQIKIIFFIIVKVIKITINCNLINTYKFISTNLYITNYLSVQIYT